MSNRTIALAAVVVAVVVVCALVAVTLSSGTGPRLRVIEMRSVQVSPLAGRSRSLAELLPPPPDPGGRAVPTPEIVVMADMPPEPPPTPTLSADRLKLGMLATNFIYRSFSQLGGLKTGRLEDNRLPSGVRIFSVTEGDYVEEDMYIGELRSDACVMALGEATYELAMVGLEIENLLEQLKHNPRPLTEEEKRLAMERYNAKWGNRFKEYNLRNPRPEGPQPPTEEEQAANRVKYFEKYGKQLKDQQERYKESLGPDAEELYPSLRWEGYTLEEQREAFNEFLDQQEKLYGVKFSAERRGELEARVVRERVHVDPSRWATPYPGYDSSEP